MPAERSLHLTGVGTLVDANGRPLVDGEREYVLDCWRTPTGEHEWRGRLDFYGTEAYAIRSSQAETILVLDEGHRVSVQIVNSAGDLAVVGPLPAWLSHS